MIRKENDLALISLTIDLKNYHAEYARCVRDGKLKLAFIMAMEIERVARKAQAQLNELAYGKAA